MATVHDGYCAGPGAGGTGQVVLRRRVSARHVLETELAGHVCHPQGTYVGGVYD